MLTAQILVYSGLVFAASVAGGTLPSLMRLTHTRMQVAMSLIGGLMLGVAVLHLLPHSFGATRNIDQTAIAALLGIVAMFLLIRMFHVHPHVPEEDATHECGHGLPHAHGHDHPEHRDSAAAAPRERSRFGWCGLAIGLGIHTLIDGIALAASVAVEAGHQHIGLAGVGTFCAIVLHKPLDAMSIGTVMNAAGWSKQATAIVICVFSLMCPLGAIAFMLGLDRLVLEQNGILGAALGFSAGVFLCIALSDLLPEVQFHTHDRMMLSAAFLVGSLVAYLITFIEPAHVHSPPAAASQAVEFAPAPERSSDAPWH